MERDVRASPGAANGGFRHDRAGAAQGSGGAAPVGGGEDGAAGAKAALIDVQRELAALKRYGGPIDGRLSTETRAALDAYRRTNGLPQRATLQDLLDHLRYTRTLKQVARTETTGSIGPDEATVKQVQTGLSELGYLPGPIDGTLGETTRQAIREFEGDRRLPVSGEITRQSPERARQDFGADEFSQAVGGREGH